MSAPDVNEAFKNMSKPAEGVLVSQALEDSLKATITARFGEDAVAEKIDTFWSTLSMLHTEISPTRTEFLEERARKQEAIDEWFADNPDHTPEDLEGALVEIGYLPERELPVTAYQAKTKNLATDITTPGPQLVVPANDPKMVLGAMNARWGSIYDSLKKFPDLAGEKSPEDFAKSEMDMIFPFQNEKSGEVVSLGDILKFETAGGQLTAITQDGSTVCFNPEDGQEFLGYGLDDNGAVNSVLLENNGLKVEFVLDADSALQDIRLESALTVIVDKEDASVSALAVKEQAEKNIAELVDGTLQVELGGDRGFRRLNENTEYLDAATGKKVSLPRSAQLLVRSVSDHMKLPASDITINGEHVSEKTWDLLLNSMMGVEYHVLPKMHNELEVALAIEELGMIEEALGYEQGFFKVGVMNEEFEMNLRLRNALAACTDRVFFVNSGFLDKFGSDLEALMMEGPVGSYKKLNQAIIKTEYERNNVDVSVKAGVGQVGAGMWPQVDNAVGHKDSKIGQILAGNDVSWDPNPLMATLHALHYHTQPPVPEIQKDMKADPPEINKRALFELPRGNFDDPNTADYISEEQVQADIEEAIFGLLAYAAPWVEKGIGCSAIPDAENVRLMEDRATARIKAAFLRNWLQHDIVSEEQVLKAIMSVSPQVEKVTGQEVTNDVKDAVYELVFNPQGRGDALVDNAFMNGYRSAHDLPKEDTILLTKVEQARAEEATRELPARSWGDPGAEL